ncbi:hypothetical protein HRbin17_02302 [bacterium HR17]|uniref:Uncharacterized protein n=1 Tax=Candidatus Fervidibacter japonicus TaxID=2035412 RepID=A0A2H5XF13_9BACT|nr:hypothetical protein HRbin17_02302 [bacterium HR17]
MRRSSFSGSESRPPNEPSAFSEGASPDAPLASAAAQESRPPNEPSTSRRAHLLMRRLLLRRLKRAAPRTNPQHLGGRIS